MKKYLLAAAAGAAVIAAPVQAKSMKCAAVSQAKAEGLFTDFNEAWATKDPAAVTSMFTKDAVLLATVSNKPRLTHAEIQDYFVSFLKGSPVATINTSTFKMGCDTVARLGTWTVTLTNLNSGVRSDVKARYSFLYRMESGKWKIDHLHSSMMPESTGK